MAMEIDVARTWPRRMSKEEAVDALSQKKVALDKEIEEFRRVKEEELRRYENVLKSQTESKDGSNDIKNKYSNETGAIASSDSESSLVIQAEAPQAQISSVTLRDIPGGSEDGKTAIPLTHEENTERKPGVNEEEPHDNAAAEAKEKKSNLEVEKAAKHHGHPRAKRKEKRGNSGVKEKANTQRDDKSKQAVTYSEDEPKTNQAQSVSRNSHEELKNSHDEGQKGDSLMKANGSQHTASKEDRELELRALFTPTFLPLLEDASHRQDHQDHNAESEDTSLELYQPLKKDRSRSDTSHLSSSLTVLPSLSKNKSDSDSATNNQPRLGLNERRSSSSPTGTGRTLRSSLRSPDHIPKERKHVLFAIDNKVISPSTSPAATRNVGKLNEEAERTPPIPFSGLRDFPFPEVEAPQLPVASPKSQPIPIAKTKEASKSSGESPRKKSYEDFVVPNEITPPDEIAAETLKMEASNPMFGLDGPESAEIDFVDYNDEEWRAEGRATEKAEEEDMFEDTAADIAASPHAGSLPVEIKWPYRWTGVI
ncbi:conserved oligomeric Golgi complex component [Thelotrema lepadinum]|nr:conserved oligomeric Golgi complex component [Thelotrema lepadinum]